jgi:hypothetical protein
VAQRGHAFFLKHLFQLIFFSIIYTVVENIFHRGGVENTLHGGVENIN